MPSFSLLGDYLGIPAYILFDSSVEKSALSSTFATNNNVPRTVASIHHSVAELSASGPVMIPAIGGWYHSCLPLVVTHLPRYDVLLGSDWFEAC
ncbi:hypothetical protein SCP_0504270 [Sparassis crispa]|uniref:Uncharacterized protein n=1 Tax=Sparassis crispa TaxID=139825 RepID=A0A401GMI5_9APHY|nr:hypothetical protein SCP_0504270 [Sparassis crispa]GBE83379.1 hypothetical protein SCP_0504270 [Sparassis crispa]